MFLIGPVASARRGASVIAPPTGAALSVPMFSAPSINNVDSNFSTASATRYFCPQGAFVPYGSAAHQWWATEGTWRWAAPAAGDLDAVSINIPANARTTPTVFTVMVNGVATALTVSVAGLATGWFDLVGKLTLAQDDLVSVRFVTGTGSQNILIGSMVSAFTATGADTITPLMCVGDYRWPQATNTTAVAGAPAHGASEDNTFSTGWGTPGANIPVWTNVIGTPGTISRMRVDIPINTSTVDVRIEMFKNNSATGLFVLIPAGSTGVSTDNAATVSVVEGDNIEWRRWATASGGAGGTGIGLTIGNIQSRIVTTAGFDVMMARKGSSNLQGYSSADYFVSPAGFSVETSEATVYKRHRMPKRAKATKFTACGTNAGTGPTVWPFTLIKNGVDTELGVGFPITSSTVPLELTDTGEVIFRAKDRMNAKFRTAAFAQTPNAFTVSFVDPGLPPVPTPLWSIADGFGASGAKMRTNDTTPGYYNIGGVVAANLSFNTQSYAAEGNWRTMIAANGTLFGLGVKISGNTRTTPTVLTVMVNGVASGLTLTIAGSAGQGVFRADGALSTPVSKGDLISLRVVQGSPDTGAFYVNHIEMTFEPTAAGAVMHHFNNGDYGFQWTPPSASGAPTPEGQPVGGINEGNSFSNVWSGAIYGSTPTYCAVVATPATASTLRVDVPTNTVNVDVEVRLYVNNAPTGLVVTIPAGTTGAFTNLGDTVSLSAGDRIEYRRIAKAGGITGSLLMGNIQIAFASPTEFDIFAYGASDYAGQSSADFYMGCSRRLTSAADNDAFTSLPMPYACTIKNLSVTANHPGAGSADYAATIMKNGVATTLAVTMPLAGGLKTIQNTGSVSFAAYERLTLKYRTTDYTLSVIGYTYTVVPT